MKKILLLIALVSSPVFAQEEEQEVEIQIETGGGVEVATGSDTKAHVATLVRRFRDDGSEIVTFESLYILIKEEGRWGIKFRSSFL